MGKKKYDNGMLKTELSEDGKIINFSLKVSDLKWLFKNSPENPVQNNIKRGKETDEEIEDDIKEIVMQRVDWYWEPVN